MSVITTLNSQWSYIYDLLKAQMNYGAGGPGTGTNTTGLLQTVASVGQSDWPEFNALPFVGVAPPKWSMQSAYTGPRRLCTAYFKIIAVVDVVASGANVIKLSDAYQKVMNILDDGNGNGVMPILLDKQNYNLGGSLGVSKVIPHQGETNWADKPSGKGTDYVAYSTVILQVDSYVG